MHASNSYPWQGGCRSLVVCADGTTDLACQLLQAAAQQLTVQCPEPRHELAVRGWRLARLHCLRVSTVVQGVDRPDLSPAAPAGGRRDHARERWFLDAGDDLEGPPPRLAASGVKGVQADVHRATTLLGQVVEHLQRLPHGGGKEEGVGEQSGVNVHAEKVLLESLVIQQCRHPPRGDQRAAAEAADPHPIDLGPQVDGPPRAEKTLPLTLAGHLAAPSKLPRQPNLGGAAQVVAVTRHDNLERIAFHVNEAPGQGKLGCVLQHATVIPVLAHAGVEAAHRSECRVHGKDHIDAELSTRLVVGEYPKSVKVARWHALLLSRAIATRLGNAGQLQCAKSTVLWVVRGEKSPLDTRSTHQHTRRQQPPHREAQRHTETDGMIYEALSKLD
mmetsp:Transcript_47589/g.146598  ORF Transcript_47589/g.146598 Transcript_47589/m.146598 type:complete len:388 (+) Transcript_47589:272-1435(+)